MKNRVLQIAAVCGVLHSAAVFADPPNVFLNGVKIDAGSIKSTTLPNVDVRFDANGDVYISARGYKVTAESTAPTPPLGGRHYYVAASPPHKAAGAQWDVDVFVNHTFVHRFRSKIADPYVEITRFVKAGVNSVHMHWSRDEGTPAATSSDDTYEISIGPGTLQSGGLALDAVNTVHHSGAEARSFDHDLAFEVPAK